MIDVKELRIGNCIFDHTGKSRFVTHRVISYIASFKNHGYSPIPLTFSILLDSGFEVLYDNPSLETFLINKSGYYPFLLTMGRSTDDFYFQENTVIKTVHHLQNLFSNITNEELVIKINQLTAK